jgi:hypothetical protein
MEHEPHHSIAIRQAVSSGIKYLRRQCKGQKNVLTYTKVLMVVADVSSGW